MTRPDEDKGVLPSHRAPNNHTGPKVRQRPGGRSGPPVVVPRGQRALRAQRIEWTRLGPVYWWWSEWSEAAVIGPSKGAWGGDDIYKCDYHHKWECYSREEAEAHAAAHGLP